MARSNQPEDEQKPIRNLGDIIEAREERRSAFADDIDDREDIDIPDDIDVDDALTFPHPHANKQKQPRAVDSDVSETTDEIIAASDKDDVDFDYNDSSEEMLPTDYAGDYNEALSTDIYDTEDEEVEDIVENAGDINTTDILYEDEIPEPLPRNFTGEEE